MCRSASRIRSTGSASASGSKSERLPGQCVVSMRRPLLASLAGTLSGGSCPGRNGTRCAAAGTPLSPAQAPHRPTRRRSSSRRSPPTTAARPRRTASAPPLPSGPAGAVFCSCACHRRRRRHHHHPGTTIRLPFRLARHHRHHRSAHTALFGSRTCLPTRPSASISASLRESAVGAKSQRAHGASSTLRATWWSAPASARKPGRPVATPSSVSPRASSRGATTCPSPLSHAPAARISRGSSL
mmetsp:Transcript_14536/g.43130  ORF Transcript_14536/g.43130 Transcript_14536/m.43130 type:complete len:242 (-) Transcript_14536:440-1165(-)